MRVTDHSFNFCSAEYDDSDMAQIGDRMAPRVIDVLFPGANAEPRLTMRIEVQQGVPLCTALSLDQVEGGQEIRSKDLRLIRIEDWLTYIVAAYSVPYTDRGGTRTRGGVSTGPPDTAGIRNVGTARQRNRRRKVDADFLTKVAAIYRDHFDDRPLQAIERAYGVQPRTAAWYVQLCRSGEYQLLPATSKGKKKAEI